MNIAKDICLITIFTLQVGNILSQGKNCIKLYIFYLREKTGLGQFSTQKCHMVDYKQIHYHLRKYTKCKIYVSN